MKNIKDYATLAGWILLLLAVSSFMGTMSKGGMDSWYLSINKSPLTPPSYVFGIVWTILYIMIAISGWMIWRLQESENLGAIKILYILQLLLNWSWTPLFFGYYLVGEALISIILIWLCVLLLAVISYTKKPLISMLLWPYLLWLSFASYLNFYIWYYN